MVDGWVNWRICWQPSVCVLDVTSGELTPPGGYGGGGGGGRV